MANECDVSAAGSAAAAPDCAFYLAKPHTQAESPDTSAE